MTKRVAGGSSERDRLEVALLGEILGVGEVLDLRLVVGGPGQPGRRGRLCQPSARSGCGRGRGRRRRRMRAPPAHGSHAEGGRPHRWRGSARQPRSQAPRARADHRQRVPAVRHPVAAFDQPGAGVPLRSVLLPSGVGGVGRPRRGPRPRVADRGARGRRPASSAQARASTRSRLMTASKSEATMAAASSTSPRLRAVRQAARMFASSRRRAASASASSSVATVWSNHPARSTAQRTSREVAVSVSSVAASRSSAKAPGGSPASGSGSCPAPVNVASSMEHVDESEPRVVSEPTLRPRSAASVFGGVEFDAVDKSAFTEEALPRRR